MIGHWKDGKLKEPENPSSMHVLKNNSTRETLRGNFSDLSVMFSCDNHLAFIPSLNKGFATVFKRRYSNIGQQSFATDVRIRRKATNFISCFEIVSG